VLHHYDRAHLARLSLAAVIIGLLFTLASPDTLAADRPTLYKRTLVFSARSYNSYWKNASTQVDHYSSWLPQVKFKAGGPIAGGSQFSVDYTLPDGKPWFTEDIYTEEIAADQWIELGSPFAPSAELEKKAIPTTGVFGYTVRVSNELTGTNDVLLSGKFKVGKLKTDVTPGPNEFGFYVDQDWRLPMGWVWTDPSEYNALHTSFWVRSSDWQWGDLAGYLFYNGKEIASSKKEYVEGEITYEIETTDSRPGDPEWYQYEYTFYNVLATRSDDHVEVFYLDQNPGDYELKVLYGGKLVRSMAFKVGANGTIVDNGLVSGNDLGSPTGGILVPVTIKGDRDGAWNHDAWKTEALYGNPLKGFSAQ
jgi:hypothetical protein